MNIWKLEWLRLLRTQRLLILLVLFILFGFIGPLTARYLPQIIGSSVSGGVKIVVPQPTPQDGIAEYLKNVLQIGLLVISIIAVYSLAIDAKTSFSIYYRTRVREPIKLVLPRFIVISAAVLTTFIVGTLTAWYETTALLGSVPAKDIIIGSLYICLYWIFCIAIVLLATSLVRGLLASAGIAIGVLILLPILESFSAIKQWMPTILSGSMNALIANQQHPSYYYQSAILTGVLIILIFFIAIVLLKNREIE